MNDDLIREAMAWAESGVPVFPCGHNKRPLTQNGFYDAVSEPDQVRALFEFYGNDAKMIGGRMGDGIFAVDVDVYKGDAPKAWLKAHIDSGDLPDTRVHETANGGLHLLYEGDSNCCVPNEGVEIKGDGGYIILPGTPGYRVRSEGLVEAPPSLLELIRVSISSTRGSSEAQLKNKVLSGADFHSSLATLAARWADKGMSQEDIQSNLIGLLESSTARNAGNERHGRWRKVMADDGGELSRIAFSAYRKFNPESIQEEFNELAEFEMDKIRELEELLFMPAPEMINEEDKPVPELTDEVWPYAATDGYFASEEHDFTDTNFTMYPIYAEGETVVMFAEPKTGKTALSLTTALHISCGLDLGSFKVAEAGPCIYFALEGSRAIRLRVASWKRTRRERNQQLPDHIPLQIVEKSANFLKEDRRKHEAAKIIAADKYSKKKWGTPLKAVFIDTLTKAMSGGDQNSVDDTSSLFEIVNLIRDAGVVATVIFVHHKSRQGNVRGSSNIEAEPDMLLDVSKKNDIIKMKIARARSIEDGASYSFKIEDVDLGVTKQGHKLSGMFVEPLEVTEQDEIDPAEAQSTAQKRKLITQLGTGQHEADEVIDAWFHAGLIKGKKIRNVEAPPSVNSAKVQEALHKVADDVGGTVFGDFIIRPVIENKEVTGFTVKHASY